MVCSVAAVGALRRAGRGDPAAGTVGVVGCCVMTEYVGQTRTAWLLLRAGLEGR